MWRLLEEKTAWSWLGLSWVALRPHAWLMCPACQAALDLSPTLFKRLRVLAKLHDAYLNKKISAGEYQQKMAARYEAAFSELVEHVGQTGTQARPEGREA